MHVNGRTEIRDVTLDDLIAEARTWRLDPGRAEAAAVSTLEGLLAVLEAGDDIPDALATHVQDRCRQLLG